MIFVKELFGAANNDPSMLSDVKVKEGTLRFKNGVKPL